MFKQSRWKKQQAFYKTTEGRTVRSKYSKKYWADHPEKYRASWKLWNAITSGKVKKQPCEVCGLAKVHGHHDDYSKPFDVRWLCHKHHMAHHKAIRLTLLSPARKGAAESRTNQGAEHETDQARQTNPAGRNALHGAPVPQSAHRQYGAQHRLPVRCTPPRCLRSRSDSMPNMGRIFTLIHDLASLQENAKSSNSSITRPAPSG